MSGRDFGRGGRGGGFGDRDNRGGPPRDRDNRGGGFGDRDNRGGGFRDRDSGPRREGGPSRPWERRDEERPARPAGDRPFDRPAGPPPERDVRVERYNEAAEAPPREERPARFNDRPDRFADRPERSFGDRPNRFGNDRDDRRPMRDGAPAPAPRAPERPAAPPVTARAEEPKAAAEPKGAAAAAARQTPQGWTQAHLIDSWNDEDKLKSWTPSNRDQQEMIEDNIEADPQIPGRDARAITVRAKSGVVTLTGTVRNRAIKFAASSDAFWTYGVIEVQNELVVESRMTRALASGAANAAAATTTPRETAMEGLEAGMTAPVTDATEALETAMTPPAAEEEAESDDAVADTATEVIASENAAATEAVQQDRLSVASESDYEDDDDEDDDEDEDTDPESRI
jgi:hypothetical protein